MEIDEAVYAVVREIPAGSVATYGQVADLVEGFSVSAREVGRIMYLAPAGVPWQRVVGAGGHLPIGKRSPDLALKQRQMLEGEGVRFLDNGRIDMVRHQWGDAPADAPGLFDAG